MTMIEWLRDDLTRESERTKRILAEVPEGQSGWKPHERSMTLGPLVFMVATIPNWIAAEITQNELDVAPAGGGQRPPLLETRQALLEGHEKAMASALDALKNTSEDHLRTTWKLLASGQVVMELPRHEFIRDTLYHWVHHRGQLSVYLRLLGAKVPSLYGPTADDPRFL